MCLRSRTELLKLGQFPSGLANKPSLFNFNGVSVYTCFLMKTSVPHSLFVTHHTFKITQQSVKPLKQSSVTNVQEKKFQQWTPRLGKRQACAVPHRDMQAGHLPGGTLRSREPRKQQALLTDGISPAIPVALPREPSSMCRHGISCSFTLSWKA